MLIALPVVLVIAVGDSVNLWQTGDWLQAHWPVLVGCLGVTVGTIVFGLGLTALLAD